MSFRLARPFLEQVQVEQLLEIEAASPHLMDDTQGIWRHHCLRDFSDLRKLDEEGALQAPDDWRVLYLEKQRESNEAKALAAARIKDRYAEHRAAREAKKTVVSDVSLLRPTARRAAPRTTPMNPLQSKGQAMLLKARTSTAAQQRRTMLVPPRSRQPARPAAGPAPSRSAPGKRAAPPGNEGPTAKLQAPRAAAGGPHAPSPPRAPPAAPRPPAGSAPSIFMPRHRVPSQAVRR